ncbi:MAG: hypothetical protein JW768_09630 [Chitinispirillaceae bacterium]|nr:hypothetical protein [Chitinispirillaceae bacterium]
MQKLKKNIIGNRSGSILVGAVALSVIIAVAGIGFLQVSSSSLNSETHALQLEQAFHAAESGTMLAATWLSGQAMFPGINNSTNPFGNSQVTIGGMDLRVRVAPNATLANTASINSEVFRDPAGSGAQTASTFLKRITVGNAQAQSVTKYTTFYDGYSLDPGEGPAWAPLDPDDLYWGGFRGTTFNGPMHLNSIYLRLSQDAVPGGAGPVVFNGPVTVAQNAINAVAPNYFGHHNYGIGHYGNNYNWGVDAKWPNPTVAQLDGVFRNTFVPNATPINLNSVQTDGDVLDAAILPGITKRILPISRRDEGSDYNDYRPTLRFDFYSGMPRYTFEYTDGAGNRVHERNYYNTNTVFIASNNINVYGTVRGAISVATRAGYDIVPVDNLTVEGYDPYNASTSYGMAPNNPNFIGLASGWRIRFLDQWVRQFSYHSSPSTPTVTGTNGLLHINASLLAMNEKIGAGVMRKGCLSFDISYDKYIGRPMQCGIKVSGNQIMRAYRAYRCGWNTTGLANQPFYVLEDTRFTEQNRAPPGFPVFMRNAVNNRLIVFLDDWAESNTYY